MSEEEINACLKSLLDRRRDLRAELTVLHHKVQGTRRAIATVDRYLAPITEYEEPGPGETGARHIQSAEYPTLEQVNDFITKIADKRHELLNVNMGLERMGV